MIIKSLGQAGFLIENNNGERLAIDPYLSDCVERIENDHMGYKRLLPRIFNQENLNLTALVCTHFHRDHFDVDSVPTIMKNEQTQLFCPQDCYPDIMDSNIDIKRVNIIKPGDSNKVGSFLLHFINCDHGNSAPMAVGVLVEVDGVRILEVGDTCLRLDRVGEYLGFGCIDILIAPINGMYGNMNEEDCIKLADSLNPKITIPCHFGMFADHQGNPGRFNKLMQKTKHKYLLMTMGEEISI